MIRMVFLILKKLSNKPIKMAETKNNLSLTKTPLKLWLIVSLFFILSIVSAQNPKIKCYFNHPVNTAVSSGFNAAYNTAFRDTLIGYINRSKYTLDFCVYNYIYSSGDGFNAIATAVNNAFARGVVVRWIHDGLSSNSGLSLLNPSINTIGSPTTASYGICHNKFVVIDANSPNPNDAYVWTGSYNFTAAQNNTDYNNIIIFQDKPLALAFTAQFEQMWGSNTPVPNLINSKFGTFKTPSTQTSFTVNGTPVQVFFSPKDNPTTYLQNAVNSANSELFFGIYAFTDNNVATAIKNRVLAGVTAQGIEDSFSQSYSPYTTLSPVMNTNIKIYSGAGLYHNKMMLVDVFHPSSDPLVCTGSYNWSGAGTGTNDENMVVVHDSIIANQYYQSFCKNFIDVGGASCAVATTGVEDFDLGISQMAVYPNPTKDVVNIKLKESHPDSEIKITNMIGEVIFQDTLKYTMAEKINISNFASGVYFVQVKTGNSILVQKIVKQ